MHPLIKAVLFLLAKAHLSGNHPDGEAQQLHDEVTKAFPPAPHQPERADHAAGEAGHNASTLQKQQAEASAGRSLSATEAGETSGTGTAQETANAVEAERRESENPQS